MNKGNCGKCKKIVYDNECVTIGPPSGELVLHTRCFVCSDAGCSTKLTIATYWFNEGKPWCKTHNPMTGSSKSSSTSGIAPKKTGSSVGAAPPKAATKVAAPNSSAAVKSSSGAVKPSSSGAVKPAKSIGAPNSTGVAKTSIPATIKPTFKSKVYTLAFITDGDENNKNAAGSCESKLFIGRLNVHENGAEFRLIGKPLIFTSKKVDKAGRGLELSDLCRFQGKLLTGDDRTGTIYSIVPGEKEGQHALVPLVTVGAGQPHASTGSFKIEWMTEVDGKLYVGSHGRDDKGASTLFEVKVCVPDGDKLRWAQSLDWKSVYLSLYKSRNLKYPPGYQAYEGVTFYDNTWWFLPRKEYTSNNPAEQFNYQNYQDNTGSNAVITTDRSMNIKGVKTIGRLDKTIGVSSFTFLTNRTAAVVRSLETSQNKLSSFLWIVDLETGKEFALNKNLIADNEKIEGVACLRIGSEPEQSAWAELKAASKQQFCIRNPKKPKTIVEHPKVII